MNHSELLTLCVIGYNKHTDKYEETEAIVDETKDCYIVIFRGTETSGILSKGGWWDIITDLRFWPTKCPSGKKAHSGFWKEAEEFIEHCLIKEFKDKEKPIILAGHSLGAALAQAAADSLHHKGYKIKEVVGFGSPRVFTKHHDWPYRITLYENGNDFVTTIPPKWFFGYKHSVKLTEIGTPSSDDHTWEDHGVDEYRKGFDEWDLNNELRLAVLNGERVS